MTIINKSTGEVIAKITDTEVVLMNTKDYEVVTNG